MEKKRLLRYGKRMIAVILGYLVLCSVIYQVSWQEVWTLRFSMRQMMSQEEEYLAKTLYKEATCFPVLPDRSGQITWQFEDGYGGERTYGGKRKHEGIDIMSSEDSPGCLTVCAAADGVVEQMGWLKLGGYRIGVRSESGLYYYYAHLEKYAKGLKVGRKVQAGEALGTMGNTGYGEEGTRGRFPVHLHFGIYHTIHGTEKSINPYPVLWYLDQIT